jgi:hypothetical protein
MGLIRYFNLWLWGIPVIDPFMKRHMGWFLWLLMALACEAAEIVAWKVPLSSYAFSGLESEGIVRLKSPPEPSPFFKEGDELWNLRGIPAVEPTALRIETNPPLEWVVWNASSARLVTKGDWDSIWQLHQGLRIDQLPKMLRLTAEVFEIPADGAALSERAVPCSTLTWVARSGIQFKASRQVESGMIQIEGCATKDEFDSVFDLQLKAACSVRDLPRLDFNSGLTLRPGLPCWVARDFDGGAGLDCRMSGRIELVDGTPLEEAVLIQKGRASESLKWDRSLPMRHRIGEKWQLMTARLDQSQVANFTPSGADPTMDSFAEAPPEMLRESLKLLEVKVPENLHAWFPRPVWDLRSQIKATGIGLKDTDFAGYDPFIRRIFLFSEDETVIDKFGALLSQGCDRSPKLIVVGVEGNGQSRLVTRSGQKSDLVRSLNGKVVRSLDIEPVIDETGERLDLRFDYLDELNPARKQSLKSSIILRNGEALDVLGAAEDKEGGKPLRLKAEIEQVFR